MEEEKTEGLLLQAIPCLGSQKILKVLTREGGLISLIAKKKSLLPMTNPFLIAEWIYKKGKGEIHHLVDASLSHDFSDLRCDFATIAAAGQIAQDLLRSQYPEKAGSGPYLLTTAYLQKLPHFSSPEILISSFRLKLLMHDGLLALQNECANCGSQATSLLEGESYCTHHATNHSILFLPNEWESLHQLTYARHFQILKEIEIDPLLHEKIKKIFYK